MGTPALTDGASATFISAEAAKVACALFQTYAQEANAGKHGGDFSIREECIQLCDDTICFEAESNREQNLDWQLDQILAFLRDKCEGLIEFNAPVLVQGDGTYWSKDGS